jgi:cytochrome c peroxidase/DNA-binding beta-propeller fold protein YncE
MDLKRLRFALSGTAAVGLAVSLACVVIADNPRVPASPPARLRHPVAAAFLDDGRTLCVANQRSGTLTLVDVPRERVRDEVAVGEHLSDLSVLPDRKHALVVDEARHELVALAFDGIRLSVRARLAVAAYPVSIAVQADGKRATIASLWSRRLQVVDLTALCAAPAASSLRITHTVRLPFAPRRQCVLPRSRQVVVADAFGGHLGLVDVADGRLLAVHELHGHNLQGLAVSGDGERLLIAHQVLDEEVPITEEKIWRGILMANTVGAIPLTQLRKPRADLAKGEEFISIKGSGQGAADPAGLAVLDGGEFAVALAGVNDVAFVAPEGDGVRRVRVGRRPTAVVAGAPGQPVLVLNTFDDSLSLVDPRRALVVGTIELGRQPALTPADRGERLFFDANLSRDGWMSCQSCHTDGHTNGLLADTLGDGTHGTPKRALTLRGTALTDPWGWNGSMKYLQDQIKKSLTDTMHAPAIYGEQVNDLLSYLHTLTPPPPLDPVTSDAADREQVERGRRLFEQRGCVRCHIPPLTYSSHELQDVGFADERGQRKFNPPSLRGVGQGYGFLHDNRAATLEELFTKYRHKVGAGLSEDELADLLRFLRSL